MATARTYDKLTAINKAGHRHVVSDYFSGSDIVREGVWEWEKPPSHLIFHPGILLVDFNGNPAIKKLILELADGYLAHGKTAARRNLRLSVRDQLAHGRRSRARRRADAADLLGRLSLDRGRKISAAALWRGARSRN